MPGVVSCKGSRSLGHTGDESFVIYESIDLGDEHMRREIVLFDNDRPTSSRVRERILCLVVRDIEREWYENTRYLPRSNLLYGT